MIFSNSFPWWMAALGLAIAALIITFTYRRIDKPLSGRMKTILITLRIASVLLILICLLKPALIAREQIHRKANLLVLVDDSQSMSLNDARADNSAITRSEAVMETLAQGKDSLIAELNDKFNVQLYQFSSDCVQTAELNLTAEGSLTDIGNAISKVADEWRGQLTAGIVLITDGGNNSGISPVQITRQTGMPVYAVGVGSPHKPQDIQVANVEVSPIAYTDHILPVKALVKSSGYDGREVPVSLMQGDELKDSASLTLDSQSQQQTVDLQLKPQQEGTFSFSVKVPIAPEELTPRNNEYPFFVKVVKSKLTILYIDGRPRWELMFLKRALQRDPDIELKCLVAKKGGGYYPEGNGIGFPNTSRELFAYDVLILGDVAPDSFSSEQLNMINDFVDKGKPLIFLGGKQSLSQRGFSQSPLRGLLPIEIGPGGARQVKGAFSPLLTQDGLRHPVTRLSSDQAENVAIWRDLPPLTQFYMGAGIKLGAIVLAEHPRERGKPVIVFQRYGEGIVLMITSDGLWRWAFEGYPYGGDDSHYRKFWSGTIRWLASIGTQAELVNVETDKKSYYSGEEVKITVYVYDESYNALADAQLTARIEMPSESGIKEYSIPASEFTSDGDGRYSARFSPSGTGHYKIYMDAHHAGKLLGSGSTELVVQTALLEFQDTQLKENFLNDLADVSGGSYHHLNSSSDLPSSIKESGDTYALTRERGLWDNGIMLMIVVALLGTEWFLRKRRGLV